MSKDKSKEKKDKKLSFSSKFTSKPILKKSPVTITIPHFTEEYEQEKRRLFFK